jgi:hypothetical protein
MAEQIIENMEASLAENILPQIGKCHAFGSDYDEWLKVLANNYETIIYRAALDEYQQGLFLLVSGSYRQAYESIRFCLEQTLFGLFLSVNELHFKLWKRSTRDLFWAEIINENTGLYCKDFIISYAPEFLDVASELCKIASQLYRELSEYVHGNPRALHTLPSTRSFSESCFNDIISKVDSLKYLVNMSFFIRYKEQIVVGDSLGALEPILIDSVGFNPQIQAFFNIVTR